VEASRTYIERGRRRRRRRRELANTLTYNCE
jgi:hypothetical protein